MDAWCARWLWGIGLFLGLTQGGLGFAQSTSDPWLILVSCEKGTINLHTTRADLVKSFGYKNVVDKDVDIGEGETEPGTVVFPDDAERRIEILWKDPDKKNLPASATITGTKSKWHAVQGISLGTSLKKLERLNEKPFHLSGFGWDYAGTVMSWDKGMLAAELDGGAGRVLLRLDSNIKVTESESLQVAGDRDFSSQHAIMQKLNPQAYQVIWVFPETKN